MNKKGTVCWFDLPVSNFNKSKGFYGELLGWSFVPMNDEYIIIQAEEDMIGGLKKAPKPVNKGESPVMYFTVDTLAPAVEKAKQLGAELVGETVVIDNDHGTFHWIKDHDKNLIALWAKN